MACSGCARRRAKMKAAYNKVFNKQGSVKAIPAASGGLGKQFTVFDQQASGLVRIPDPQ